MHVQVLAGIIFFPFILFLEFRTRAELQLMPQTVEDHIQDMKDSDSDTDTDSDTDSVSSHHSAVVASRRRRERQNVSVSFTQVSRCLRLVEDLLQTRTVSPL